MMEGVVCDRRPRILLRLNMQARALRGKAMQTELS